MMNILINPKTGNITGIIDWSKSRILPFGFALYRLENLLGRMHSEGWHYYNHHRVLENLFQKTFQKKAEGTSDANLYLIRSARMAGLFYCYGFVFDIKGEVQSVRVISLMVPLHISVLFVLLPSGVLYCELRRQGDEIHKRVRQTSRLSRAILVIRISLAKFFHVKEAPKCNADIPVSRHSFPGCLESPG